MIGGKYFMSKNFELLQQIERGWDALPSSTCPSRTSSMPAGVDGLSAEDEPLINLVQRLFLASTTDAPRTVVFSGADRSSGCTWVCAHTCKVLAALMPGCVCAVDGNLRSPGLHDYFELETADSWADAPGENDAIQKLLKSSDGRLSILCPGSPSSQKNGNLDLYGLRSRIRELRQEFEYVLVDAPSLDLYTDAIVLAGESDGLIMVLGANSSRRKAAQSVVEALQAAKVSLLGAVLNKRVFPIPEFIYRRL
jgi:hypothetical protein